jgi:rhodanese-related sulfurtransferase
MKKILFFLLFIFALPVFSEVSGLQAYELMTAKKAVMLDIREKDEIKEGMIKGATWLPLSELNSNPTATVKNLKNLMKDKELYIYCRSGRRADAFISQIKGDGIKGLNLGGYSDLVSKGLPSQIP